MRKIALYILFVFVLLTGVPLGAVSGAFAHGHAEGAAARAAADYAAWKAERARASERAAKIYRSQRKAPAARRTHKHSKARRRGRTWKRIASLRMIPPREKANRVVVLKSERKLVLMRGDRVLKVYRVALGRYAEGAKRRQGDAKTPEGAYVLDYKLSKSSFYKALHISYPNAQDIARVRSVGADPGGKIMIHGIANDWTANEIGHPRLDWTQGCIAVDNHEMDEIIAMVQLPAPIEIHP